MECLHSNWTTYGRSLLKDKHGIASKLASRPLRASPSLRSVGTSCDNKLANSSKLDLLTLRASPSRSGRITGGGEVKI